MEKKQHWENVYQHKAVDEVSWFQAHPEYSLDLIQAAGVTPMQAIIDVGGGASRLVDKLLAAGYCNISVLDIAAAALTHTQARLGARAAEITWLESDVTAFTPPQSYALWHDRAVFHFLTEDADRQKYLCVLRQAVPVGGHVIIATFALDGPEQCSNLPVQRYDESALQAVLGAEFKLLETRCEAHQTPVGKIQHFMYARFQRQAADVTAGLAESERRDR
jgi:ubiquinone/menaquinone biosynthesis C-methylase UbiE